MMIFRLLLSLLLLQSQTAFAQNKIWVRAYDTSLQGFQVFLQSSSRLSYAEFQVRYSRKQAQNFRLKDKLISAQKLYLDGKQQKAMKFFNQITKESYSADWSEEDRRIITYAFLRSAQIQEDKTQAFLILARTFYGSAISKETYSDFDLFPPPLMSQLEKVQETNLLLSPDWGLIFPNHEILLINGQRIDKESKRKFLPVSYRVTALSSSHKLWSKKIHLSKLVLKPVQTEKLTSGFCEKIELIPELKKQKRFQLFSVPKCKASEKLLLGKETLKQDPTEQEMKQNLELSHPFHFGQEDLKPSEEEPDTEGKWSHLPTWLLVGAGIVALSLLVSLGGNKKESEEDFVY